MRGTTPPDRPPDPAARRRLLLRRRAYRPGSWWARRSPTTVLPGDRGRPRLSGFDGLLDRLARDPNDAASVVVGHIESLPPERLSGSDVPPDARGDVYGLGVVLFRLLTGAFLIDAATPE